MNNTIGDEAADAIEALEAERDTLKEANAKLASSDLLQAYEAMQAQLAAAQGQEPFAYLCVLQTKDAGPTKFFTAPSDPRGFPVYTREKHTTELDKSCTNGSGNTLKLLLDTALENSTQMRADTSQERRAQDLSTEGDASRNAAPIPQQPAEPIGFVESAVRGAGGFHACLSSGVFVPAGTQLYAAPIPQQVAEPSVPEGWKLVPVEPTELMVGVAERIDWASPDIRGNVINQWQAMLAAAPQPKEKQ